MVEYWPHSLSPASKEEVNFPTKIAVTMQLGVKVVQSKVQIWIHKIQKVTWTLAHIMGLNESLYDKNKVLMQIITGHYWSLS